MLHFFQLVHSYCVDRDSSVAIATRHGLDGPDIEFRCGRDFQHPSILALVSTQPPVQWEKGSGVKRLWRGVDHRFPNLASRLKIYTRWFKYDRDYLCVNKSQFVPVIFEPPCIFPLWAFMAYIVRHMGTNTSERVSVALFRAPEQRNLKKTAFVAELL
jgi:hypothetical protein